MIIAIGCDHRGFLHKEAIKEYLQRLGHESVDCGCHSEDSTNYPDHAIAVGQKVASGEAELGVLVCGSGIGVSIAANKVPGVRASLCCDRAAAETTRQHNDSNVLCLSGDRTTVEEAVAITQAYLAASFEGGRHARRVEIITGFEAQN